MFPADLYQGGSFVHRPEKADFSITRKTHARRTVQAERPLGIARFFQEERTDKTCPLKINSRLDRRISP